MWNNKIDPYAPCYCGSGKKYKFCCQHRIFDLPGDASPQIDKKLFREAEKIHDKGLKLMDEHKFEEAIQHFKRAIEINPAIPSSANNLAICYFVLGNVEEALEVQRNVLKQTFYLPSFALANLSMFLLFNEEKTAAENALYIAASEKEMTLEATLKICEMFARLRRYQELFDFASSSPYSDAPALAFWIGAAAANIGNERAAKEYLSNVPSGDPRLYLARDYLDHLANGTRPESVRGDWPMLTPMDFHMRAYFLKNPADSNPKLNNCWAVDFVEACINDPRFRGEPGFLDVLRFNTHPEAAILLRKIAAGSVGTDELRQQASMLLVERGDVKSGDEVELQYQGKKNKVALLSVELDSAYEFCPLPEEIAGEFKNTISATHENNPDWGAIVERYRKIIRQCPAYFPAEFNLAGVLYYHSMNIDEAERIARRLVAEHPDYLFAHSLLLDILSRKKLYKEAEKLLKDTEIPAKTHPDALKIWLKSQFMFYIRQKKTDEAKPFLDALEAFPGKKDPNIDDFKNVYNEIVHIQGMITEICNGIQNLGNKRRKRARKRK